MLSDRHDTVRFVQWTATIGRGFAKHQVQDCSVILSFASRIATSATFTFYILYSIEKMPNLGVRN